MSSQLRHTSPTATVLAWVGLGALGLVVFTLAVSILSSVPSLARRYPEFTGLQAPSTVGVLAVGVCIEAALAITGLLVAAIRDGRIFERGSLRLVDALITVLIVATVVFATTLLFIPGPLALGLVVLGGVFMGATAVLVLVALRSLLREAMAMQHELAEVV